MEPIYAVLGNAQAANATLQSAWTTLKPFLLAGHQFALEIKPATRSLQENALLHAEIGEVSKVVEWAGKKRSIDTWKRLLTAAWLRARGESVEVLPALDGHGVDIVWRSTSKLTIGECSELIDYVKCWRAQQEATQ